VVSKLPLLSMGKSFPIAEPWMQQMFVDSRAPDELTWLISNVEAISPEEFDRAMLDGPRG